MKLFLKFLFTIGLLSFLVSCGDNVPQGGLLLKGNVKNASDLTTYFDKLGFNNSVESIAQTTTSNGNFSFKIEEHPGMGLYRVRMGAKSAILLLDGNESKIELNGELETLPTDFTTTGAEATTAMTSKLNEIRGKEITLAEFDKFISEEASPLVAMGLTTTAYSTNATKHELFSVITNKLKDTYGADDEIVTEYSKLADQLAKTFAKNQAKYRVKVGQPAPDFVSNTPAGKEMKLSDLKGDVVLLDFWASWCGPCRRANPHVVKMYDKYKDKGFKVFNVSLDGLDARTKARFGDESTIEKQLVNQKKRWTDAIKKDNLYWPHHVSDLKKWDSDAAAMYGVRSIPSTFLIDREGNLAALNPSKSTMEGEILKLL